MSTLIFEKHGINMQFVAFIDQLGVFVGTLFVVIMVLFSIIMTSRGYVLREILLNEPDDWHVHFRDGDMLSEIVLATANHFKRALVMPNLLPPLTTVDALLSYRQRILNVLPASNQFQPFMTLYINESISPDELIKAKSNAAILGAKLYPAGVTTNSEQGVQSIQALYPLFAVMQSLDLVLQIHGEVIEGDIFDRERIFIETVLQPITKHFPTLRIVLEHISTSTAVDFVLQASEFVAATITPHHLAYNRNHMLAAGIKPHYYCLPILKQQTDQYALQQAAVSGNRKFFAGTDSAPHLQTHKESRCGCAGIYSAPYALAMYAQVFDNLGACNKLNDFLSCFGARFYQMQPNQDQIQLVESPHQIPETLSYPFGTIVPAGAGTELRWRVNVGN